MGTPDPAGAHQRPGPGALAYAVRAWAVLPLHSIISGRCSCRKSCPHPAKHPITRHGLYDASTEAAVIRSWWDRFPFANVGVRTGEVSGMVALEVDPARGGNDSLAHLQTLMGSLAQTLTARTGGAPPRRGRETAGSIERRHCRAAARGTPRRHLVIGSSRSPAKGRRHEGEEDQMRKRIAILMGTTVLSLGSTSVLPVWFSGLPYSSSGMSQAEAKPGKDCDNWNDGEEIVDGAGLWECDGQAGKWGLIAPP